MRFSPFFKVPLGPLPIDFVFLTDFVLSTYTPLRKNPNSSNKTKHCKTVYNGLPDLSECVMDPDQLEYFIIKPTRHDNNLDDEWEMYETGESTGNRMTTIVGMDILLKES